MALDLTNGQRPAQALQQAMGNGAPRLTDEQCAEFNTLLEENGGAPFGWPEAQEAFREQYEIEGDRWVKRKGAD